MAELPTHALHNTPRASPILKKKHHKSTRVRSVQTVNVTFPFPLPTHTLLSSTVTHTIQALSNCPLLPISHKTLLACVHAVHTRGCTLRPVTVHGNPYIMTYFLSFCLCHGPGRNGGARYSDGSTNITPTRPYHAHTFSPTRTQSTRPVA